MLNKCRVPSSSELQTKAFANDEIIDNYIDGLYISTYNQEDINRLEDILVRMENCDLKRLLEKSIQIRKNQLKQFQEQAMQFERKRFKLNQEMHQLEIKKHKFHIKIQASKLKLQYVKIILLILWVLAIFFALYAYILQPPRYVYQWEGIQKQAQPALNPQVQESQELLLQHQQEYVQALDSVYSDAAVSADPVVEI